MQQNRSPVIRVRCNPDLNYQDTDEIRLYVNNQHAADHLAAKKFPLILWKFQLLPCATCDGEGYEIIKCFRFNHNNRLNSKYQFKARCGVCFGFGVAWCDRKRGIDYKGQREHNAHMAASAARIVAQQQIEANQAIGQGGML